MINVFDLTTPMDAVRFAFWALGAWPLAKALFESWPSKEARDALEPLLERLTVRRNYLLRIQRRGKRVDPDWRPVPDQRAPLVELTADDRARLQRDLRACSGWRLGLLRGALWGLTCANCHLLWGALLLCLLGLVTVPWGRFAMTALSLAGVVSLVQHVLTAVGSAVAGGAGAPEVPGPRMPPQRDPAWFAEALKGWWSAPQSEETPEARPSLREAAQAARPGVVVPRRPVVQHALEPGRIGGCPGCG